MGELQIIKLRKEVPNGTFDCGNSSINSLIVESYFPTILQHGYAYQVSCQGVVLGYYMIKFRNIKLDSCPEEISDYKSTIISDCCSVHISYIAINKKYQNKSIGTSLLNIIIKRVLDLCREFPVMLLTLEALKDKYDWYINKGFKPFDGNELDNSCPTINMYMLCILDQNLVDNYYNNI